MPPKRTTPKLIPTSSGLPVALPVHNSPTGTGGPSVSRGVDQNIINMQKEIINIAHNISDYSENPFPKETVEPDIVNQKGKVSNQWEIGRHNFNNFFNKSYIEKPKLSAKQENKTNLKHIVETLRDVGSKPFTPDGSWGNKTTQALFTIAEFSPTLIKMAGDFNIKSSNLNAPGELKSKLPKNINELSSEEKSLLAKDLTESLKNINNLFTDIRTQILDNPANKDLIEADKPLETYNKKSEESPLNNDEELIKKDLEQKKSQSTYVQTDINKFQVNVKGYPPFMLSAADLLNKDTFINWVNSNSILMNWMNNYPDKWPGVVKSILGQIKSQINQKMTQAKGPAPTI